MRSIGSVTALMGAALLFGLAGCGVTVKGQAGKVEGQQPPATTTPAGVPGPGFALPARPAGRIDIDGRTDGSLSPFVVRSDHSGTTIDLLNSGEDSAFRRLCNGQIDIVDSARTITQGEARLCKDHGLPVVELQTASDAVVVVTKNENDVGGDCLTSQQIRDVFRAGSPIGNWSQVGFDNLPLTVTGPAASVNPYSYFVQNVLMQPPVAAGTLGAVRADYKVQSSDFGIRDAIVGHHRGWVGFVRYSFYEGFENLLRPIEVDANQAGQTQRNCIFPSQTTVTNGNFPLARRMLLYVTRRSLARPEVHDFLLGYLNQATSVAVSQRFVPIPENIRQEELAVVQGRVLPPVEQTVTSVSNGGNGPVLGQRPTGSSGPSGASGPSGGSGPAGLSGTSGPSGSSGPSGTPAPAQGEGAPNGSSGNAPPGGGG